MRHSLLFLLLIALSPKISAQEPLKTQLAPCGTLGISDWLKASRFRQPVMDRSEDTMWVAIKTHLLAKDNGTGRISIERYLDSFCQLNEDFNASNVQFFMKDGWNLLNESDWHIHNSIPEGIDMMLTNNVPDALNAYFVADPAGNCGYNLPYAGVAIAHSCSGDNDHTWAHEVGHALNLPHPFIGWEGKLYNFNTPTPTVLTYDYTYFHDTIDTQVPAPLDTALVELVDGSNCAIAADRICDTPPDYLSYRWECDAENKSLVKQKDPNGDEFYSDGTLFMSYALDQCQNRFSPEEINIMRATLLTEKLNWLATDMPLEPITDNPIAIEPVQDQIVPSNGAVLRWKAVPNATHYLVQASRFASFSFKQLDIVTTDTFAIAGQLTNNLKYYWRIRPFNNRHTCASFSALSTFKTSQTNQTAEPDADGWRCYPSVLASGQLMVEIPENWQGTEIHCRIHDASGRLLWQQKQEWPARQNTLELPSTQWPAGIYLLTCTGKTGSKTARLTVDGLR